MSLKSQVIVPKNSEVIKCYWCILPSEFYVSGWSRFEYSAIRNREHASAVAFIMLTLKIGTVFLETWRTAWPTT